MFNQLYTLANMPIQRFGSMLISKGQFDDYLDAAAARPSRRQSRRRDVPHLISVDWRGYVYDCDFNQMLDLPLTRGGRSALHLADLLDADLEGKPIRVAGHCYGCTAGQGSSCGGALKEAAE